MNDNIFLAVALILAVALLVDMLRKNHKQNR
jgi:hypothetical protein